MNVPNRCVYCRRRKAQYGRRGRCCQCSRNPALRLRPADCRYARRGVGLGNTELPVPPYPTRAGTGTGAKILIMAARLECGFAPHHPLDATDCGATHAGRQTPSPSPGRPHGKLSERVLGR